MGREASKQWLKNHLNERYFTKKEAKFELVGCPVSGIYCSKILPEINALYNDSESAHINKEYQNAIERLKKAYFKTFELKESNCESCVKLFQGTIKETIINMQDEVKDMSFSFFCKKQYEPVYQKFVNCIKRISQIELNTESSDRTFINC